jgi:hypothetical protein
MKVPSLIRVSGLNSRFGILHRLEHGLGDDVKAETLFRES